MMNTSFFFADKARLKPDGLARGVKCVTQGESLARGVLPAGPYPAVLLVEALAQLGGFAAESAFNKDVGPVRRAVLARIRGARMRPVDSGSRLELSCRLVSALGEGALVEGEAFCAGRRVAKAALTYTMRVVDEPQVHEQRKALYEIWSGA